MDNDTLVTYMLTYSHKNMFDGKGRLFLPEFQQVLPEKVEPEVMIKVWRQAYPNLPIFQATNNVILISLDPSPLADFVFTPVKNEEVCVSGSSSSSKKK